MTRINIDGTAVERPDGRYVCLGYYIDSEGRVCSRFALPPGEYPVDDVVDSAVVVDSRDDLPPVDDVYREQ